jgi:hypothetical protein
MRGRKVGENARTKAGDMRPLHFHFHSPNKQAKQTNNHSRTMNTRSMTKQAGAVVLTKRMLQFLILVFLDGCRDDDVSRALTHLSNGNKEEYELYKQKMGARTDIEATYQMMLEWEKAADELGMWE